MAIDSTYPSPVNDLLIHNVTSCSFFATWSSKFLLNYTVKLLTSEQEVLSFDTDKQEWLVTGLKPGALYVLRVVSKVCALEGQVTESTVRTAGLTLEATARITNMQFKESFHNTSSTEYLKFTEDIQNEILKLQSADIQDLVAKGKMKIIITSITSGSIKLFFLIVCDKEAFEMVKTRGSELVSSLGNSVNYTFDSSGLSITDYDECARNVHDCSSNATCRNIFGSFECYCKENFQDILPMRPGRICKALTSEFATVSHTRQTATSASTAAFSQRSTTSTISPEIQKTSPLSVTCMSQNISVAVTKAFLNQKAISESSLYLGIPQCNVSSSNDTHVMLTTAKGICGTNTTYNNTYTILKTILSCESDQNGGILASTHLQVPITCIYYNQFLISSGYSSSG
ncbi:uromodulin-like 1, partial [Polypterus senegalus]|uniref:uromodulin-like 1 n=1 Tax=Polypterus senegalus TaxID=55291 RepID=UPI0019632598